MLANQIGTAIAVLRYFLQIVIREPGKKLYPPDFTD